MSWDRIRSSYDAVAGPYEERFVDELAGKPRDREILEAFARFCGDPVVEIGCGPGQVGAFVRQAGRLVIGVDLSSEMARRAALRVEGAMAGDMRALPIADRAAGGLLAFYSVIHLRRRELAGALSEFRRVLRPGGQVVLSAHEGEGEAHLDEFVGRPVPMAATFFQLDELAAAARGAGLEVLAAERRDPYPDEHPTVRLYLTAVRPSR